MNTLVANKASKKLPVFLKWVGGKRKLLDTLLSNFPSSYNHYYEPFVGGGALTFALAYSRSSINDVNSCLINFYKIVRDNPNELLDTLQEPLFLNNKDSYYSVRKWDRNPGFNETPPVLKAARFWYLNRSGYGGLFRYNKKGQMNTPYGNYKDLVYPSKLEVQKVSNYLRTIQITNLDFSESVKEAQKGDFVYFDPPYIPESITANFTAYQANGFGCEDHQNLRKVMDVLTKKGVFIMLSNSNTLMTRLIYVGYQMIPVNVTRSLNAKKSYGTTELIITNY